MHKQSKNYYVRKGPTMFFVVIHKKRILYECKFYLLSKVASFSHPRFIFLTFYQVRRYAGLLFMSLQERQIKLVPPFAVSNDLCGNGFLPHFPVFLSHLGDVLKSLYLIIVLWTNLFHLQYISIASNISRVQKKNHLIFKIFYNIYIY